MAKKTEKSSDIAKFLLSSDTLGGYGLDLVFQTAKDLKFDGIDLALWKNYDARNLSYVKKLVTKYKLPVEIIQLSSNINAKEMNQALDLAEGLGTSIICMNAPSITNISSYKFITSTVLKKLKLRHKNIKFCIINPPKSSLFVLPIPKYYFTNVVDVVKKHKSYIGFDMSNLDEATLEINFLKKMDKFIPYMPVVYLSDKSKNGEAHIPLGDGVIKLPSILRKFKENNYTSFFSLKIDIEKKDLADLDKVEQILKKCINLYKEEFVNYQVKSS